MSIFSRADQWAAKRLFFPVIVKVCQLTKVDQYQFASYCFVASLLFLVPPLMSVGSFALQVIGLLFITLILVVKALTMGLDQFTTRGSSGFWRGLGWAMIALGLFEYLVGTFDKLDSYALAFWLLHQFAEYARMIDTIPPTKKKQKVRKLTEAKNQG